MGGNAWGRTSARRHRHRHHITLIVVAAKLAAVWSSLLLQLLLLVDANTDPSDVKALGVLYTSLNSPPQLSQWNSSGGDPCGESWKGISCSGSAVVGIQIQGLRLSGSLGYLLSDLLSLKTLDVSNNNIHEPIPYQLPPNLSYLNLASNNFSGNLPYSISSIVSVGYLNTSQNLLSQAIGDIFTNLQNLSVMDLSFNNLTGNLPTSLSSLSNLSSLYLQDNQLSGPVNLLSDLDLNDLNLANNRFSGWVPKEFSSIPNLRIDGNTFTNGPAPPPPPPYSSPPKKSHSNRNHSHAPSQQGSEVQTSQHNHDKKGLIGGPIIGIGTGGILIGLCTILAAICCLRSKSKSKEVTEDIHKGSMGLSLSKDKGEWHQFSDYISSHAPTEWSFRAKEPWLSNGQPSSSYQTEDMDRRMPEQGRCDASVTDLKPPPLEKTIVAKAYWRNGSGNRVRTPIMATSYTVAALQTATNSFGQECLIGEGSLGRVYRADFPNAKVLAVKKIDCSALSIQEEDNFLEAISNMSRLRHQNITTLLGYCVEHGQCLLVYEYIGNGTLHDMLHYSDDHSEVLSWNARVKVALGTARALEYLHEVCLPSIVHRNLKSANVLLDEELNPHLSDCGLAVLMPNPERQVLTQTVGSFGYSAPEFALSGVYTVKSDVYSLGVLMLELLTGRKPLDSSRVRSEQSLVRWAIPQLHDIDALSKMIDPLLNGIYPAKSLSRFADIIALCIQPEPEFRPPMSEVVQSLVRLVQRTSMVKRLSGDELGFPQSF